MLLVRDGSCCLKFKGLHGRETLDGVAAEAILYGATISACEKGWFLAASLLGEMKHVHLRLDVINFNASVSIFRRGCAVPVRLHSGQRRLATQLLSMQVRELRGHTLCTSSAPCTSLPMPSVTTLP